jgi:hypothetical protein
MATIGLKALLDHNTKELTEHFVPDMWNHVHFVDVQTEAKLGDISATRYEPDLPLVRFYWITKGTALHTGELNLYNVKLYIRTY